MIPSPWIAVVLALGVYRLCRLVGWDDFPPVAATRAWLVGQRVVTVGTGNQQMGLTATDPDETVSFARPLLEQFLHCPFCVGFWLGLAAYGAWLWEPRWTLYALFPLALNAAVGLTAKNLDP